LVSFEELYPYRELASFVPKVASGYPDGTAMVWPGRKITYTELNEKTARVANTLARRGIRKGHMVGALMLNSPEMVFVWLGALRAGCVFIPYNNALKGELLAFQLSDSRPRLLFLDAKLEPNLQRRPSGPIELIVNGGGGSDSLAAFTEEGRADNSPVDVSPSDPAMIMYTSGTTGDPKAVVLPHFSFANRVREIAMIVSLKSDDVFYNTLPLFHTSGQMMTTLPALMGGFTVLEQDWFHASSYWKFAAEYGATVTFLLGRMVNILLQAPEENFVPNSLRVVMSGGVRKKTLIEFANRFGVKVLEGFGMTETCGIAIFNTLERNKVGSIGRPLPSVDVMLAGEGNEDLSANEIGELMLRPKVPGTFLSGYLNKPWPFKADGWFATGDLVSFDTEGFAYYVERKKDVIRSKEENIMPGQIEAVAESHPSVLESAAVGVRGAGGDEEILLAVKARPGLDPLELLRFLDERLPFFMVPRYLRFVDEMPRTPNEKIRREALRAWGLDEVFDSRPIGFKPHRPGENRTS